jgi:HlyD family secretion protein
VLFTIAQDLRHMQVQASVDEADIGHVRDGQQVTFQVDAYPGERFAGVVRQVRLAPVIDQNVVSYVTVVDVPNPDLRLKPGMTATVAIELARADDVLKVPNAALRYRPDAATLARLGQQAPSSGGRGRGTRQVWVLADGGAGLRPVPVQVGVNDGTTTAITGGELQEGARVVTGAAQPAAASSQAPSSGSPLVPQRPRRTGNGGGR